MRAYLAVFRARFQTLLQYRAAAAAGFGTQLFWGLMRVMIFGAFYAAATTAQPMSLEQTVTYLWLTQALLMLVPWTGDPDVADLIRSGDVVFELARPVSLYGLWFARAVALRTAPAVLRSLPMFVVAGAFLGLGPPASPSAALAFACAVVGAILLSSAFTVLQNVFLFWTVSGVGAARLFPTLVMFCSGMFVPLPLLPEGFQPLLSFLPFRGLIDVPFRLYLGHLPPARAPWLLLHQGLWLAATVVGTRWLLGRGLRRLAVQGG